MHGAVVLWKYVPARQNLHAADVCAFSSWYLPAEQDAHGADVFTNEKPWGQNTHCWLPVLAAWYLPAEPGCEKRACECCGEWSAVL